MLPLLQLDQYGHFKKPTFPTHLTISASKPVKSRRKLEKVSPKSRRGSNRLAMHRRPKMLKTCDCSYFSASWCSIFAIDRFCYCFLLISSHVPTIHFPSIIYASHLTHLSWTEWTAVTGQPPSWGIAACPSESQSWGVYIYTHFIHYLLCFNEVDFSSPSYPVFWHIFCINPIQEAEASSTPQQIMEEVAVIRQVGYLRYFLAWPAPLLFLTFTYIKMSIFSRLIRMRKSSRHLSLNRRTALVKRLSEMLFFVIIRWILMQEYPPWLPTCVSFVNFSNNPFWMMEFLLTW